MKLSEWLKQETGRGSALAAGIGIPQSLVSRMATGDKQVPLEQCVPIEQFTGRAVTCEEMRPDKVAYFAYLRSKKAPRAPEAKAA